MKAGISVDNSDEVILKRSTVDRPIVEKYEHVHMLLDRTYQYHKLNEPNY